MQSILILSVILILQTVLHLTASSTIRHTQCGRRLVKHKPLLLRGSPTEPGDWPWAAAIYHVIGTSSTYKCGGTLLNSNTVITAAHCVYESEGKIIAQRVRVQLGKYYLMLSSRNTQEFQAHTITQHPDFNLDKLENDIAIICLSTEATFTDYVQPICLWESNRIDLSEVVDKVGVATGWGMTEADELSSDLKCTNMPVVSFPTCLRSNSDVFGKYLSDNTFCAGFLNGSSVCSGDSGGSLVFEENGVYRIRGIVSLTAARGNTGYCSSTDYVLFTDVAQYLTWIESVVPDLDFSNGQQTPPLPPTRPTRPTWPTRPTQPTWPTRPIPNSKPQMNLVYQGCYRDKGQRAYTSFHIQPRGLTTLKGCANMCYISDYKYTATENSNECYCYNTLPNPATHPSRPESDCNKRCVGDRSDICGGVWALSVYSTGL